MFSAFFVFSSFFFTWEVRVSCPTQKSLIWHSLCIRDFYEEESEKKIICIHFLIDVNVVAFKFLYEMMRCSAAQWFILFHFSSIVRCASWWKCGKNPIETHHSDFRLIEATELFRRFRICVARCMRLGWSTNFWRTSVYYFYCAIKTLFTVDGARAVFVTFRHHSWSL